MFPQEALVQLKELLASTQNVFIIMGAQANLDQLAVASSLSLALAEAGKDIKLACPQEPKPTRELAGLNQLVTVIGNQNLSISFDYDEQAVDKVSYHIGEETNKFYLTIKPKKGHPPLNIDSVELSYTGAEADLVFLIGVGQLDQLDQLYFGYEDMYRNSPIVTIGTFQPEFGLIKLDASGATCLSEPVADLIEQLDLSLNSDAATNLLTAIEECTDGFRSMSATATTFETVAKLMKAGARRTRRPAATPTPAQVVAPEKTNKPAVVAKKPSVKNKKETDVAPGSLKYQPSQGAGRS